MCCLHERSRVYKGRRLRNVRYIQTSFFEILVLLLTIYFKEDRKILGIAGYVLLVWFPVAALLLNDSCHCPKRRRC
jgi:hypothetical protein